MVDRPRLHPLLAAAAVVALTCVGVILVAGKVGTALRTTAGVPDSLPPTLATALPGSDSLRWIVVMVDPDCPHCHLQIQQLIRAKSVQGTDTMHGPRLAVVSSQYPFAPTGRREASEFGVVHWLVDSAGVWAGELRITAFPRTFLIVPGGRILSMVAGVSSATAIDSLMGGGWP